MNTSENSYNEIQIAAEVWNRVRGQVVHKIELEVEAEVRGPVWDTTWNQAKYQVWDTLKEYNEFLY